MPPLSDPPKSSIPPLANSPRPVKLGRYHLLKRIGLGGMAEIWVARVTGISDVHKICVVKRILPHLADSPEFVRMFLDEARIAATLAHPNLVQMYDVAEVDKVPLIAMEYLHGEDLRALKKTLRSRKERMPLDHAIHIAMSMAAGLHYAHEKVGFDGKPLNIVHRDISPHNVIVTYEGAVKVLDFGIAKAANRMNETRDGALKGKIPYMSPEQCRSERLDRRSDIYSTGIILYEMATGHRIFRRGATEFEIMRAIVEDPVTPPTRLVLDFPPEMERIILKCLAKNRAERYATARDLQVDLEAFARENRLNTSPLSLSSFMGELFGQRAEAWRDAVATGGDLIAHIVERSPASELLGDDWAEDAGGADAPPRGRSQGEEAVLFDTKRSAPLTREVLASVVAGAQEQAAAEPRVLTVTRRKMGSLVLVSLSGRMTEAFQGQALAREVSGRVIFDLAGVERVTSFGVREWLQMLNEASSRVSELYIARCSEPIVNQVSMIRRFVADGRITSFYGPYRCESCGSAFNRLFDCEKDAEAIQSAEPPPSPCPRCGEQGVFDDDAESYFAFANTYAGEKLPKDVRAVLDDLAKGDSGSAGEAIEKIIDERATRVRVSCKLDASVRWKRVLDGIEGDLVIDLSSSTGVTPEGVKAFELAVRGLGDEVRGICIEGCPRPLIEHLIALKPPLRATIASALVDARCDSCNAMRSTLLDIKEGIAAALEDRDPYVPCKRCNAALSFAQLRPLLRRMGGVEDTPAPATNERISGPGDRKSGAGDRKSGAGDRKSAPTPAAMAGAARPARPGSTSRVPALMAAALGAAVTLGIGLAYRRSMLNGDAPGGAASAASTGAAADDAPPAWAAQPFVVEGDRLLVVGRGEAASREAALAIARNEAIAEIMRNLVGALEGSPIHRLLQTRGLPREGGRGSSEAIEAQASRYLQQVGTFATPERVEARFLEQGGQVTAIARYRLRKESFDAAAESYRRTVSILGMKASPLFPLLERGAGAKGDVVVAVVEEKGAAALAGLRAGDVILGVNGQRVTTLDALQSAVHKATPSGPLDLEYDAGGTRHTARIYRR